MFASTLLMCVNILNLLLCPESRFYESMKAPSFAPYYGICLFVNFYFFSVPFFLEFD